jgi:hypothetical protein
MGRTERSKLTGCAKLHKARNGNAAICRMGIQHISASRADR